LSAAGVDWESALAGRALGDRSALRDLGEHGSARAARLVLALSNEVDAASGDLRQASALRHALAAFVDGSDRCGFFKRFSTDDLIRRVPLATPEDVQAEILRRLARDVRPDADLSLAEETSRLLVRLCRGESVDAFRVMTKSRYAEVRQRAAQALAALGEAAPPLPPAATARVRIRLGGLPLTAPLDWTVATRWSSTLRSVRPDDEGVVELDGDSLLDSEGVEWVQLQATPVKASMDPWFSIVRPSLSLDAVTPLELETQSLTLVSPPQADAPTIVRLVARRRAAHESPSIVASQDLTLSPAEFPVTFSRLQRGEYVVEIVRNWSTVWTSPLVQLGDTPVIVELPPVR
jgi:hypothetical protein